MKPIPTETATDVGSVGKWLGAAAAGALLMYLLDPERGTARRSRALSAMRAAGARTGATVDGMLHSAGDRLVGLKDSAANALSRGADSVQAQAAPMLERARHGAQEATHRLEDSAQRLRERAKAASKDSSVRDYDADAGRTPARSNRYEPDREYGAGQRERGGLSAWLRGSRGARDVRGPDYLEGAHPALVGGGMLGLLSLMRRSPGGLLIGLAGLALLWQGTRDKTYRVSDNIPARLPQIKHQDEHGQAPVIPPAEQSGSRYLH